MRALEKVSSNLVNGLVDEGNEVTGQYLLDIAFESKKTK